MPIYQDGNGRYIYDAIQGKWIPQLTGVQQESDFAVADDFDPSRQIKFRFPDGVPTNTSVYLEANPAMTGDIVVRLPDTSGTLTYGGGGGTVTTQTDRITGEGSVGDPLTTSDGVLIPWTWTTGNITAFPTTPPKQAYEVDSTGIYLNALPSGLTDGLEVTLYATAGVPININYNLSTPPAGTARIEATQTFVAPQRTDRVDFPDMITLKYVAVDDIWTVKSRSPRYPINPDVQTFDRGVGKIPIGSTAGLGEETLIEKNLFAYTSVLSEGGGTVSITTDFHGVILVCDDPTCNQIYLPDFDTQSAENLFDGWKVHVRVLTTAMAFESLNPAVTFDTTGTINELSIQNYTDYTITFDRNTTQWRFSAYSRYFLNNSLTLNSIPWWNGSGLVPSAAIATSSNGRLSILDYPARGVSADANTVMVGAEKAGGSFLVQTKTVKQGVGYYDDPIWVKPFAALVGGANLGSGSVFTFTGTSASAVDTVNGFVTKLTTAATANAAASAQGGSATFNTPNSPSGTLSNGYLSIFTFRPADASYGSGATGVRIKLGLGSNVTEADWNGAAAVATTLIGMFLSYDTSASDTNWMWEERRSSTQTSGRQSTGIAFVAQNTYRLVISAENRSDTTQLTLINLNTGASSTILSGNTFQAWTASLQRPAVFMRTLTTTARNLDILSIHTRYGMKFEG
jgi:hypothetical protein